VVARESERASEHALTVATPEPFRGDGHRLAPS
jgi:hypothetical protein